MEVKVPVQHPPWPLLPDVFGKTLADLKPSMPVLYEWNGPVLLSVEKDLKAFDCSYGLFAKENL